MNQMNIHLLAVQGPNSKKLVEKLFNQEIDIEFYSFITSSICLIHK